MAHIQSYIKTRQSNGSKVLIMAIHGRICPDKTEPIFLYLKKLPEYIITDLEYQHLQMPRAIARFIQIREGILLGLQLSRDALILPLLILLFIHQHMLLPEAH